MSHRVWNYVGMRGMDVVVDPYAPLTRETQDADGIATTEQVLCWVVDGVIRIHPDRWELVLNMLHLAKIGDRT